MWFADGPLSMIEARSERTRADNAVSGRTVHRDNATAIIDPITSIARAPAAITAHVLTTSRFAAVVDASMTTAPSTWVPVPIGMATSTESGDQGVSPDAIRVR